MKIETCSIFMKWNIFWFKYHLKHLFDISAYSYIWRLICIYGVSLSCFKMFCAALLLCTKSSNVAYLYWQCMLCVLYIVYTHGKFKNVVLNEIQHFVIRKDSYLCTSQNVPFEMRKVFQEFLECFVQEIDRWLPFLL